MRLFANLFIKDLFTIRKNELLTGFFFILAGFITGEIVTAIISIFVVNQNEPIPAIATLFAWGFLFFYLFIYQLLSYQNNLRLAISMGKSRSGFLYTTILLNIIISIFYCLSVIVLQMLENAFYTLFVGQEPIQILTTQIWIVLILVAVFILSVFPVFIIQLLFRYGVVSYFIFWGCWMLVSLSPSRIASLIRKHPDSALSHTALQIKNYLSRQNSFDSITIYFLIFVICSFLLLTFINYRFLMKSELRL